MTNCSDVQPGAVVNAASDREGFSSDHKSLRNTVKETIIKRKAEEHKEEGTKGRAWVGK